MSAQDWLYWIAAIATAAAIIAGTAYVVARAIAYIYHTVTNDIGGEDEE